uniref:Neur_chan_LBD domain-containing protein n=1 Tax=Panagrellus redivivus TaxID=6233 RepID=A0A7E4UVB2_PANRE
MQLSHFSLAVLVLASAVVALRPKLLPEFDRASKAAAANRRRQTRSRGSPPEPRVSRRRTVPEADFDEDEDDEDTYPGQDQSQSPNYPDNDDVDIAMDEADPTGEHALARYQKARQRRGFGAKEYLLPENFRSLRRKDIPVTYRLHDDLLRYYRKGTRPVTHPNKIVSVQMTTFLYQIIKLDAVQNTISLSGSFELVSYFFLLKHGSGLNGFVSL